MGKTVDEMPVIDLDQNKAANAAEYFVTRTSSISRPRSHYTEYRFGNMVRLRRKFCLKRDPSSHWISVQCRQLLAAALDPRH